MPRVRDRFSKLALNLALASALLAPGCGGESASAVGDLGPGTSPDPLPDPVRACMAKLPRLTVVGNQLRARCGSDTVQTRLKGLNRSGLQHKNGLMLAGFGSDPTPELTRWRDQWKAVIVRLPVGQSYYTTYAEAPQYQKGVADIVAATKALGLYLMIELHGYDAQNLDSAQPDPTSTPAFWAQVAQKFGAETHVLFDIWNEPHSVPWSTWKVNAEKIIRAIRDAGATETLVVVGGLDYAYDLSALQDPQNRITGLGPIIYATHPYPLKSNPPSMAGEWDLRFGNVAREVPVIIGEYGVNDSGTSPYGLGGKSAAHSWMMQLHTYIDQHQLSALAWSGGDEPQLTLGVNGGGVSLPSNPPDPGRPTDPFGNDVLAWMLKPLL
jgi:hypothetical protein